MIFSFFRKERDFDRENEIPVLRSSICTGERVAGFFNKKTQKFTEERLIKTNADFDDFLRTYKIKNEDVKREW